MTQPMFNHGHALIVGVGADLPCTVTDAKGLASILENTERCAYPENQVKVLTEAHANRKNVLHALDTLAQTVEPDATLLFYFSGHGVGSNGAYYLITHGYDTNHLAETTISGREFANKIAAIPAARKIILLDCCHAGGVGDIKSMPTSKSPLPPEALDLFTQGSGYVLIASSTEQEVSYAGKPYSVFTKVLIEALCGAGVAKQDGYVRVADLAGHTREQVPQSTANKQHPVLHFEQADNFVIAYYAGGKKQPKGVPFQLQLDESINGNLAEQIKKIEDYFVQANYKQAYERFQQLCNNYPDYQSPANMLLSRFNELENQIMLGTLTSGQQAQLKNDIAVGFQTCLLKFKNTQL